jgi:hypothetical protein
MVSHIISDSREISFRLDDCPSRKAGRLLPIGVNQFYQIFAPISIYCGQLSENQAFLLNSKVIGDNTLNTPIYTIWEEFGQLLVMVGREKCRMKPKRVLLQTIVIAIISTGMVGQMPPSQVSSAAPGAAGNEMRLLQELLKPDGSLDLSRGYQGALDPSGYRLKYGPNGAPLFKPGEPTAPANAWNALGGGLNNTVKAIAVEGPKVYMGGDFTDAGMNLKADRIARWDSVSWKNLGNGLNNTVNAIAVAGSNVYAGGLFTFAGGDLIANHIAVWDGTAWKNLGASLNGPVNAIVAVGSKIYVGGGFTNAGGNPRIPALITSLFMTAAPGARWGAA